METLCKIGQYEIDYTAAEHLPYSIVDEQDMEIIAFETLAECERWTQEQAI